MPDIQFKIGAHAPYQVPGLTLTGQEKTIKLTLVDGDHEFTSENFELGTVDAEGSRALMGHLTFSYSYDAAAKTVTVHGTDFQSPKTMALVTQPKGLAETCIERAAGGGYAAEDLPRNNSWNYDTSLMPGAKQTFNDIVRQANDALIAALQQTPGLIVQVRTKLPQMSSEDLSNLGLVYTKGKLTGLFDPEKTYGPDDKVITIQSVFGGVVTFNHGEYFANVIGSTPDPKIAGLSWIKLWANQFGFYPNICTSYNFNGFNCTSSLVGGHVITGKQAKYVAQGSNSVYIFPICKAHNNNDNVYMSALKYFQGIWLWDYRQP